MKPLISVVVPVYNVENLLHYAVDSLLKQDYGNIEIILVNDGSSDKSGAVCDAYAEKYENISVYHKENGGQSSARNLGLKYCKGTYIGFIDSDDWVSEDMYSYLHSLLVNHDADVSSIAIQPVEKHDAVAAAFKEKIIVKEGSAVLQYYMEKTTKSDGYSVCRCLFKRELLEGISFREGRYYEDIDYKFLALRNARKYVESNLIKYFYLQTGDSTSLAPFKPKDYDLVLVSDILCDLCEKTGDSKLVYYAKVKQARTPFSLLLRIAYMGFADGFFSVEEKKRIIRNFSSQLRSNLYFLIKAPIKISRKLMAVLLALNYNLVHVLLNVYKKWTNSRKTDA